MGSNGAVQLVVVEDQPVYRDGLVHALDRSQVVQVVAQVSTGRDGIAAARSSRHAR